MHAGYQGPGQMEVSCAGCIAMGANMPAARADPAILAHADMTALPPPACLFLPPCPTSNIRIPETGKIYSFNEGNSDLWSPEVQAYITSLKNPETWGGKPYSARYIGSLVGDFHRTLLYGGIYGYPGDAKNKNGKLRLLYECAPMSYLAEQAGGAGSTGVQRVRR